VLSFDNATDLEGLLTIFAAAKKQATEAVMKDSI
jgi:hypothetical protein